MIQHRTGSEPQGQIVTRAADSSAWLDGLHPVAVLVVDALDRIFGAHAERTLEICDSITFTEAPLGPLSGRRR
jgi:hypothetical protein